MGIVAGSRSFLALGILCLFVQPARPATFTVNDLADTACCNAPPGPCSLRGAILAANTLSGPDTVLLPAGVHLLTLDGPDEDASETGDLDITDDLTISGAGEASTIVEALFVLPDRVFHVQPGVNATISGATIRKGNSTAGSVLTRGGGGVRNEGTATLADVIVSDNVSGSFGGGLHNPAT